MRSAILASVLGWAAVVGWYVRQGQPRTARVLAVMLGVESLLTLAAVRAIGPLAFVGQPYVWFWLLRAPVGRMPSRAWQVLVNMPAAVHVAAALVALPWSIAGTPALGWLPAAMAAVGVHHTLVTRRETVRVDLRSPAPDGPIRRAPELVTRTRGLPTAPPGDTLRVVQITDPHLGTWMPPERLRGICERAVACAPDLVLLTGDFLTFESHHDGDRLAWALEPLARHPAVYACRGNHDLETPEAVANALAHVGARLLVDEAATVHTRLGPVQLVGIDFRWNDRPRHLRSVLSDLVRPALRIVLLHDPGAFRHVPPGAADLVLSGHTHGGHVGLTALGIPFTAVASVGMPDHGPWTAFGNRMYVHRANGHYGFPIRLGVRGEESCLEIALPSSSIG